MHCRFLTLILSFFILSQKLAAQGTPKTLLWKITGKSFTKPCYLYGTMHTKDKRAYYLGDSVYSSIQLCDGFAMEIDPAETIDTVLAKNENEKLDIEYRKAIENDILEKGPDFYKKSYADFDSMLTQMRKKFRDMSYRQMNRLERAYRRRMKNDMRTRLDLYLFDLAKTQGKVVGAVEDLIDQTSIDRHDEKRFDEDAFVQKQKGKYADFMEWMIETYTEAELDKIQAFSLESNSPQMRTIMLYNRNDKMARRIDSLGSIRSTFCAVGCAHLPGDSGVINLLRQRGFTVEPVFSSKKIEPGDIVIENKLQSLIEIADADSNYVVQMPGRPTDYSNITNKLVVKVYKELSNDILMMCGVYEDGKTFKSVNRVVEEVKKYFSLHDIKLYDDELVKRQEMVGHELVFRNRDGYIRMHIFCNNGKTYMFGAGSREKDSMYSVRCTNYLSSYKMFLNRSRSESAFSVFSSPEKAFSIAMPTAPRKENINGNETSTREEVSLFTSIDTKSKTSYLVMVKEPFKGFFPNFDSTIFDQALSEIKRDINQKHSAEEENIILDGNPALKLRITVESDSKRQYIYAAMLLHQNRFYCITARGLAIPENERLFEEYINSLHFITVPKTPVTNQENVCNVFSVKTVSPVMIFGDKDKKTTVKKLQGTGNKREYYAFDSSTATTYAITSLYHGPFYWANDEAAFLNEYAGFFFNEKLAVNNIFNNDSLLYKKDVLNGNTNGKELLIKNIKDGSFTRLRLLHYADSAFIMNMKGSRELVSDITADSFFSSFRFINEKAATNTFASKTQGLINSLKEKDSVQFNAAIEALKIGFKFPGTDMPLLLNNLMTDFANSTTDVNELLAECIAANATDEVADFIKANYPALKNKNEHVRMLMFEILAAYKTGRSYGLLKDYLLNDQPANANYNTAFQSFQSSPALVASFFPELCAKIRDKNMVVDVLTMANIAIDSNQLSYSILKEYEEDILQAGKKMLEEYEDHNYPEFYVPHVDAVLKLLVRINQKNSATLLRNFSKLQNHAINLIIMMALAKNDQPIPADMIDRFCGDPNRQIELYDELMKIGKQSLFVGDHATQKSFAEAFASIYTEGQIPIRVSKDYDVVAVKEASLNEKPCRFYIVKVKCHFTYENISYSCIIGPFDSSGSILSIPDQKEKYILYRKRYNADEIDVLFNDYISKVRNMR